MLTMKIYSFLTFIQSGNKLLIHNYTIPRFFSLNIISLSNFVYRVFSVFFKIAIQCFISWSQEAVLPLLAAHLAMYGDIFRCHSSGRKEVLLASCGNESGMLLNLLECSGLPFPSKTAGYHLPFQRVIQSKMSIVLRLKNCFVDIPSLCFSDM